MIYESSLNHHGIKGQKWGKQNGPPYPLNRSEKRKNKDLSRYSKTIENRNKASKKYDNEVKTYLNERTGNFVVLNPNNKTSTNLAKAYLKEEKMASKLLQKYKDVGSFSYIKDGQHWCDVYIDNIKKTVPA